MKSPKESGNDFLELQEDYEALKTAFDNYIVDHNIYQQALKESEEKYRMIVENLNDIIYTADNDAKITYVSPNFELLAGYPSTEAIGKYFIDFVHPEDKPGGLKQFHKVFSGINESSEFRMITRDGGYVWMKTHARPLVKDGKVTGVQGVLTEISDLKESEKRLNTFISHTPVNIYSYKLIDGKLHIIYVNDNVKNVLGYEPKDFIGKSDFWFSLIHPDDYSIIENTFKINIERKDSYTEYRIKDKKGNYRWVQGNQKVNKINEREIEVIGAAWDITALKHAEEELIKAKEKAEESDRLKSAFLANMSHEIRTPMNGILGFAELLKAPGLTGEKRQEFISIIEEGGGHMLNIINNIVDISKIESGLMEVSLSKTNINEQIQFVYNFFKPEVENKGMQFSYKNGLPFNEAVIKTDGEKIYAILTNLVKNSIKYTSKGSIEFGYNSRGEYLQFFVKDSGSGIPEDQHQAIFERFIQADTGQTVSRQGAGLGLSITRAYVEMLGGKIWVISEAGRGSEFYFTIPNIPGERAEATEAEI